MQGGDGLFNKHLEAFILTADNGSFSKAAQQLFISSNALIKQINLLEAELNLTLFIRTNHGVRLTKAGESIYRDAKRIISISKQAIETAYNINSSEDQIIRVGSSLMYPAKPIMNLWINISNQYPNIDLKIIPIDDSVNLFDKKNKNIDLFVSLFTSHKPNGYNAVELTKMPVRLTLPRRHRLARKKKIKISDLTGEKLLIVKRGNTENVDLLREDLEKQNLNISFIEVPPYNLDTFNYCEKSGYPMISSDIWSEIHPMLITIPCDWKYTIPFGIVYEDHPNKIITNFISIIEDEIKNSHKNP